MTDQGKILEGITVVDLSTFVTGHASPVAYCRPHRIAPVSPVERPRIERLRVELVLTEPIRVDAGENGLVRRL